MNTMKLFATSVTAVLVTTPFFAAHAATTTLPQKQNPFVKAKAATSKTVAKKVLPTAPKSNQDELMTFLSQHQAQKNVKKKALVKSTTKDPIKQKETQDLMQFLEQHQQTATKKEKTTAKKEVVKTESMESAIAAIKTKVKTAKENNNTSAPCWIKQGNTSIKVNSCTGNSNVVAVDNLNQAERSRIFAFLGKKDV